MLIVVGMALLLAGSVAALVRPVEVNALAVQAAGAAVLAAAGAALAVRGGTVGSGFHSGISPAVGADRLTGLMLVLIGAVSVPALVFGMGYLRHARNRAPVAALGGLFVACMAGVVLARDPSVLLAGWELMTLLPAVATLLADASPPTRRAMVDYLAITHVGGAGVWVSVLVLAHHDALGGVPLPAAGGTASAVALLALVGFGTKAGLAPMHVWLPRAHPVAPSHLSAVMSGAMVAVAMYGLIRVLLDWTVPPAWVGPVLLGVGALTALVGIVVAASRPDMKTLLAHSTVEHMGIAAAALGACVWLRHDGLRGAAALAFGALMLQLLTHAVAKAALFLAAGSVGHATGTLTLTGMGGLARRMPTTAAVIAVAGFTLAAVPPTAGFAAEWAVLQGVVATARLDAPWAGAVAGTALLALAAAAGLAALTVAKLVGLLVVGPPRAGVRATPRAMDIGLGMPLAGLVALVGLGGVLLPGLSALYPGGSALDGGVDLLDVPFTGGLAPLGLLVALVLPTALLMRLRGAPAPAGPIWLCGQPATARSPWSGAAFTKSFRVGLDTVLGAERHVSVERDGGVVQRVHSVGHVPDPGDTWLVRPVLRYAQSGAAWARRLQSGSLRAYLAWLVGMVLASLLALRLGVL